MDYLMEHIDKIISILLLISSTIGFRLLLEMLGQRWITTYAHTATLTLLPVITFVITKVISGNIALSLGMVGALSIVRFRHPVRSPLELSVYFGAITMGIAAAVSLSWLAFLVASIVLAIGSLAFMSLISRVLFKRDFFNVSFSEGNSLSTLELFVSEALESIDHSQFLTMKAAEDGVISYVLTSNDFDKLKKVLSGIENDTRILSYQLNA